MELNIVQFGMQGYQFHLYIFFTAGTHRLTVVIWPHINNSLKYKSCWLYYCPDILWLHTQVRFGDTRLIENGSFFPGTAIPVDDCKSPTFLQKCRFRIWPQGMPPVFVRHNCRWKWFVLDHHSMNPGFDSTNTT